MAVMQTIKDNPWKILLGSSGTIISLVATLFTLDARYAHAADVEKDKAQTQQIIKQTSQELRKQMLEDKIFELDIKKSQMPNEKLSPVDNAMRERYQRQLRDIKSQ